MFVASSAREGVSADVATPWALQKPATTTQLTKRALDCNALPSENFLTKRPPITLQILLLANFSARECSGKRCSKPLSQRQPRTILANGSKVGDL
ncbi:MAG: hypothetical protein EAZ24_02355 [Burkholderiales bacterium]|nr:MAG: hypothetical protein EAZ21_10385 [Betaproteobacteria bacterium]TAG83959.1 MAG: hypothetical protein EAZ24_02355 [Burkholderiales bacterium]